MTFSTLDPNSLQWASSDESIATVDAQGQVTGVSCGIPPGTPATISATQHEHTATTLVEVIPVGSQSCEVEDGQIAFTFSGFLHAVSDPANLLGFQYSVGDRFTGSFSYPRDLMDTNPDPLHFHGQDFSRVVSSVTLAGHVFSGNLGGTLRINSSEGQMSITNEYRSAPSVVSSGRFLEVLFRGATTPFDDMLPTTLSLSDFSNVFIRVRGQSRDFDPRDGFELEGTIDELTLVPEPSTWIMMATGLLALGFVAWRRRENEAASQV